MQQTSQVPSWPSGKLVKRLLAIHVVFGWSLTRSGDIFNMLRFLTNPSHRRLSFCTELPVWLVLGLIGSYFFFVFPFMVPVTWAFQLFNVRQSISYCIVNVMLNSSVSIYSGFIVLAIYCTTFFTTNPQQIYNESNRWNLSMKSDETNWPSDEMYFLAN